MKEHSDYGLNSESDCNSQSPIGQAQPEPNRLPNLRRLVKFSCNPVVCPTHIAPSAARLAVVRSGRLPLYFTNPHWMQLAASCVTCTSPAKHRGQARRLILGCASRGKIIRAVPSTRQSSAFFGSVDFIGCYMNVNICLEICAETCNQPIVAAVFARQGFPRACGSLFEQTLCSLQFKFIWHRLTPSLLARYTPIAAG